MKYKLINKKSCSKNGVLREGESCRFNNNCIYPNCCETICDKVTIDGFDYYVSDGEKLPDAFIYDTKQNKILRHSGTYGHLEYIDKNCKKVIATTNPNIDIPKVVDEVERLAHNHFAEERFNWEQENPNGMKSPQSLIEHYNKAFTPIYKAGYNKSQETHPFSEEDMIEFLNWIRDNTVFDSAPKPYHRKTQTRLSQEELLQLWEEQKPKIVYYE